MLSSRYRFHGHGSLRFLLKNGKTSRNRCLAIRYIPNPRRKYSRVAVVVGKKVAKSAVKRNRIRRRIFEVIRTHWDDIAPNHDISVAVFSPDLLTMSHTDVTHNVLSVLKHAQLLQKNKTTTS